MFVDKLFEIVEKEFGVTKEELLSKNRYTDLVIYRRIISYYLRKNGYTFHKVADIMKKDHATIIFYIRTFDDELCYNDTFAICHERVKYKIKALINESKQVSE
jgi:chromosomal replication initiation ATPase DnaA